jgi:retinol dehydrogenase 12
MSRYSTSKLMQILFLRELVKHTKDIPVITAVTPGLAHSELANRSPSTFEHIGAQIFKFLLARKTDVGARTLVAGACAGPAAHGQYMEDCKVVPIDSLITGEKLDVVQKKTYEQTLAYIEKLQPGVSRNI